MKRFSPAAWPAALALLVGAAWPGHAASRLFASVSLEAEGGYAFPTGNLKGVFDPAPDFGVRATSSYYGPLQAHVLLHGAHLDGGDSPVPVWVAAAGVGLEYRTRWAWLPAPGLGVSLDYARVRQSDVPAGRSFFMEDGESEFGFYPSLRWRVPVGAAWFLIADLKEDIVLSEPRYSRMVACHIGAGWRWK